MTDRHGLGWAVAMVVVAGSTAGRLDAQADPLARLGWLAGCWEARAGNRVTTETWMVPSGGLMIGGGRTVVDGVARSFEHLRIRADGTRLLYVATPSGQRETTFPSAHLSDTLLVFENPEHDFPQRIAYRRVGADSVVARVEGPRPGGVPADSVCRWCEPDAPSRRGMRHSGLRNSSVPCAIPVMARYPKGRLAPAGR